MHILQKINLDIEIFLIYWLLRKIPLQDKISKLIVSPFLVNRYVDFTSFQLRLRVNVTMLCDLKKSQISQYLPCSVITFGWTEIGAASKTNGIINAGIMYV